MAFWPAPARWLSDASPLRTTNNHKPTTNNPPSLNQPILAVAFQLVADRPCADAQLVGRALLVVVGFLERLHDHDALHVFNRLNTGLRRAGHSFSPIGSGGARTSAEVGIREEVIHDIDRLDHRPLGRKQYPTLNHILQLANVTRPRMLLETQHQFVGYFLRRESV